MQKKAMEICIREKCTGCGLCESICPSQAITIGHDDEGFRYPQISSNMCIGCLKCRKMCPVNSDINAVKTNKEKIAYAGFTNDEVAILNSSSGGIVGELYRYILSREGLVFGVQYNDSNTGIEYVLIDNACHLPKIYKSKYFESDRRGLYKDIRGALATKKEVLVVGLPCDIAAVRSLVGNPENLYTVKLVCMANTSEKAFKEYVKIKEAEAKAPLKSIDFRYKELNTSTFPVHVKIEFENGLSYNGLWENQELYKAFFLMNRTSCYNCKFKLNLELADITVGDFQGLGEKSQNYNKHGVSLVLPTSDKGKKLLGELNNCHLEQVNYDEAINYNWMIYSDYPKSPFREQFSKDFCTRGLKYACDNLAKIQNDTIEEISKLMISSQKTVVLWGAGLTLTRLYDRLQMEKWNIQGIVDTSTLKIGNSFKDWKVEPLEMLKTKYNNVETIVSFIPAVSEEKLNDMLSMYELKNEIVHIGKYKFYR